MFLYVMILILYKIRFLEIYYMLCFSLIQLPIVLFSLDSVGQYLPFSLFHIYIYSSYIFFIYIYICIYMYIYIHLVPGLRTKIGDLKEFVNRFLFVNRVFDKSFTNQKHLVKERS